MYEQITTNKRNSYILITFFFIFVIFIGYVIGTIYGNRYLGIVAAVFICIFYTLWAYYSGDKTILSLSKAREAKKGEYLHLVNTVEGLAIAAGIPKPKVYVIEDPTLNAFATGRDPKNSAIAVTTGLLEKIDRSELEGVVAHEMSHIKNYDTRIMMLTAVLVGSIVLMSDFLLRGFLFGGSREKKDNSNFIFLIIGLILAILSPIIANLIKLAVSRKREYLADASGAMLTRYPEGLASALEKIGKDHYKLTSASNATAHLYIANPFNKESLRSLFSTHPPLKERIKRLRSM